MAGKTPEYGPTARTVAANITRLREAQNLKYTDVSGRMKSVAQWDISPVGVRRMENLERRITVDDLVALARALDVSPATLLMPMTEKPDQMVGVTGSKEVPATTAWVWLTASPVAVEPSARPIWASPEPPAGSTREEVLAVLTEIAEAGGMEKLFHGAPIMKRDKGNGDN